MITLPIHKTGDKTQCCGCNACGDICAHGAISFHIDEEGFWYPEINHTRCLECRLCESVCPMSNDHKTTLSQYRTPICIGAYHKDQSIRMDSTSGGVFSVLAEAMYKQNGYVSGAVYTNQFDVVAFISNDPHDLSKLRRSKYAQSSAIGLYRQIRKLLASGRHVLACGTPCQMAAVRNFLGKEYTNLIIVDILCKSCNSPKVFHKYLSWLETRNHGKVVACKERDKGHGWNSLTRRIDFDNGQTYFGKGYNDHFQRGFQYNVYQRPSCYTCKFKGIPRYGDITLGDFWGIENVDKALFDNKGTSLVLLNNEKGKAYFETIKHLLVWKTFEFGDAIAGNQLAIVGGQIIDTLGARRKDFFCDLDNIPFNKVAKKYFPLKKPSLTIFIKNTIERLLKHI